MTVGPSSSRVRRTAESISPSACTANSFEPSGVMATPATKLSLLGRFSTTVPVALSRPPAQLSSRTVLSPAPEE